MEDGIVLNKKQRQKYALLATAAFAWMNDSDSTQGAKKEFEDLATSLWKRAGLSDDEIEIVSGIALTPKLKEYAKARW